MFTLHEVIMFLFSMLICFFFNVTATTEIYTLSLHDALPICTGPGYEPFALRTADGRSVPVQLLARRAGQERRDAARHYPDQDEVDEVRIAFRAPPVPGLGLVALTPGPPAPLTVPRGGGEGVQVRGRAVENRFVEVALEPSGALTLLDRGSGHR